MLIRFDGDISQIQVKCYSWFKYLIKPKKKPLHFENYLHMVYFPALLQRNACIEKFEQCEMHPLLFCKSRSKTCTSIINLNIKK